jgi:hypothetical protein
MMYDGINFNEAWIKSISLEQFLAEVEVNKDAWWPGDAKRKEKAKEVYNLINPKAKAGAKAPAAAKVKDSEDDIHGATSNDQQV